jgi:putative PIN family toxin of toxin-antitoxin system
VKVVFDAGVVFSGAGWRGEAHLCVVAMARRRVIAYATEETLEELAELVARRGDAAKFSPGSIISWYQQRVKVVQPTPLGKQRSRDAKDDPYLACALGAEAKVIVSRDEDLLVLEKPFGVEIITPRELLRRLTKTIL